MPEENITFDDHFESEDIKKRDCSTCRWWTRAKPMPEAVEVWGMEMFPFGECRAAPPSALQGDRKMQAVNDPTGQTFVSIKQARFPHTQPADWCGMWTEAG